MSKSQVRDAVKLISALVAALLINAPLCVYRYGQQALPSCIIAIGFPFLLIAVIELLRGSGRLKQFVGQRTLNGMLFRAVLCSIPTFISNVFGAVSPVLYSGGLQGGMMVGLLTPTRYATLDQPNLANRRYWRRSGAALGILLSILLFLVGGRSRPALVMGLIAGLVYAGGLWLGLLLGNLVTQWIAALAPTFQLLRQLGRTLAAFAAGYVAIVVLFATFYGAIWRMEGMSALKGLPASPDFAVFLYFSLVTATTVGYGDIVPQSLTARSVAGIESLLCLAWTLVVFAALAVRFADTLQSKAVSGRQGE